MTKFFFEKKTLIKKFQEKPAFFLVCFCAKDGNSSSITVRGDRFFVICKTWTSKWILGRYDDQVSKSKKNLGHHGDQVSI